MKPLDVSWKDFGKILNDLSYQTTRLCNAAVQMYWEYHNMRLRHKAETGKYSGKVEENRIYGCSFRNHVYRQMREIFPLMASSNVSQTNQFALKRWKTDVPEIMRLQKSIPSFRLGTPIQVANQNYRLSVAEGEKPEYRVEVTLLGKEAVQGRFILLLDGGDAHKKAIFRRIVEGKYKQGTMQIVKNPKKKKWFCVVSYSFTLEKASGLDESRVMGVNFASSELALFWVFNFGPKRGSIPEGEIIAAEKKISAMAARQREIQRTAVKSGHGRKRRLKATEGIQGTAAHIRDTLNHKYSRRIVDIAIVNRCGVIRLADMSGVKTEGALGSWPWADLAEKIRYKAEEKGIAVEKKDRAKAYYTCSKCGYSHQENIDGNKEFLVCKNPDCRTKINLTFNATVNITADV